MADFGLPDNTTGPYGNNVEAMSQQIQADASNILSGDNPPYSLQDFLELYPGFGNKVPSPIIQMYLDLANACIKQSRWKSYWKLGISLFIAHFSTLYLQSAAQAGSTSGKVIAMGEAKGLTSSKSVGDVSKSVDFNLIAKGIDGWAQWMITDFGMQLITIITTAGIGKGGMGIG